MREIREDEGGAKGKQDTEGSKERKVRNGEIEEMKFECECRVNMERTQMRKTGNNETPVAIGCTENVVTPSRKKNKKTTN